MDFTFVTPERQTEAAMFGTYEGSTEEITNEITALIEDELEIGTLIEIDWVTNTVIVDADKGAVECDACGNYRFVAVVQDIVIYGEVDDVFKFCQDCIDGEESRR